LQATAEDERASLISTDIAKTGGRRVRARVLNTWIFRVDFEVWALLLEGDGHGFHPCHTADP
jgi:hypothetical protein